MTNPVSVIISVRNDWTRGGNITVKECTHSHNYHFAQPTIEMVVSGRVIIHEKKPTQAMVLVWAHISRKESQI